MGRWPPGTEAVAGAGAGFPSGNRIGAKTGQTRLKLPGSRAYLISASVSEALPSPVAERLVEIPDGRRGGFESSTEAASSEVVRSYLYAAEALADAALAEPTPPLATCDLAETGCARTWIERIGRLAFRRPLTAGAEGEVDRYLALYESIRASQDAGAAAHAAGGPKR